MMMFLGIMCIVAGVIPYSAFVAYFVAMGWTPGYHRMKLFIEREDL